MLFEWTERGLLKAAWITARRWSELDRRHFCRWNRTSFHETMGRVLSRLAFRFDGQSGVLPGAESVLERPDVFVTTFLKFLRQTGA